MNRPSWSGLYVAAAAVLLALGVLIGVATSREEPGGPPAACLEALEDADALIDASADALGLIAQAFEALGNFELDRVEDLADRLDVEGARELRAAYDESREECRG